MRRVTGGTRAVIAIGLLVAALSGCSPTGTPSAAGGSTPVPATASSSAAVRTASPTARPVAGPAVLTLTASQVITNGSVGTVQGTVKITVRNSGLNVPTLVLNFTGIPVKVGLNGSAWDSCTKSDNGTVRTVSCPISSVPVGSSAVYTYVFDIALGTLTAGNAGRVTVAAVNAQEPDLTDNSADLSVCTNGCGG